MDFGMLWKIMEIDNASIRNVESFGKGEVFQNGFGKLWIFVWEVLKYPKMDTTECPIKYHIWYVYSFYYS